MSEEPVAADKKEVDPPKKSGFKNLLILVGVIAALGIAAYLIINSYCIVTTDDAYVSSHVTFVAPQVAGKVDKVLVEDNNRVHKGDILVEIDKRPFQVQVDIYTAAVESAKAELLATTAQAKSDEVNALSLFYKMNNAIENVNSQVAQFRQDIAALNQAEASLNLAKSDFNRAQQLFKGNVSSHQEFDTSKEQLRVAQSKYNQALEAVNSVRTGLGLPSADANSPELQQIPDNLNRTFSAVQESEALLMSACEKLGITFPEAYLEPDQLLNFFKQNSHGNEGAYFSQILTNVPSVKEAQAKLEQAQGNLEQAVLNLHYCDVTAAIDGVITRRNLNPGNYVQAGQQLMAIRSLTDIWVNANFKETQLSALRIGQPVDLITDMYGGHHVFKGRISGFTMGTGSTLALLPPENATGNFVKVVQRLPVRIDILNYDADKITLFVGLSVTPNVHIRETPVGPNAGKFLQGALSLPFVGKSETPVR
jgi:membrane fusion protein (multidrug efflux system)